MSDCLQWSAAEIARQIRAQAVTVSEVVEAHITRIEQVNPMINAVITPTFEQARQQAREADERIAQLGTDDLPPLFGVPVTIKDCWSVAGVRFTGGSSYHRDDIAEQDAEVVRRLKEAGAIILGKTNLPDMCWSGETVNPVFGRTNNPHNVNYSAGGSSGGEGAIIAAGGSPLGIGSDIAGSVRIPAAMNGCVSIKPTAGRVPSGDHFPAPPPRLQDWNSAGPMARRIEDLALALDVLSDTPLPDYRTIDLNGRRCLLYINGNIKVFPPVRKSVSETVAMAAGSLKSVGMDVIRDESLPIQELVFTYVYLMSQHGNAAFKTALGGGEKYKLWDEIQHIRKGQGRISASVLWFTQFIDLSAPTAHLFGRPTFERVEQCKRQMSEAMGAGGVILSPLLITPPPKHGWIYTIFTQIPYSNSINALGFPSVIVPVGYNARGLPMAVQVIARPDEDEVALAVAAQLEQQYGGWRMAQI
ncbi:MAG: amidase [Anaerolineae bacterium]